MTALSSPWTCPLSHAGKVGGRWLLGDGRLVTLLAANGVRQVKAVCPGCGSESGAISYRDLPMPPEAYPVYRDNVGRYGQQPCEVNGCGDPRTELHHFAPGSVFNGAVRHPRHGFDTTESDLWPSAYICRTHHVDWHRRMVGYRWNQGDR